MKRITCFLVLMTLILGICNIPEYHVYADSTINSANNQEKMEIDRDREELERMKGKAIKRKDSF